MGEIAGVNTASLGVYLHSTKTKARWAEGFHDELNGHEFDLERDGSVKLYLARNSPYDENKQPYHTGTVAARVEVEAAVQSLKKGRSTGVDNIPAEMENASQKNESTESIDRIVL